MSTNETNKSNAAADFDSLTTMDYAEVERIVARARAEQSKALFEMIVVPVARFVRAIFRPVVRLIQERRTADELSRLSDRELADMGIRRSDIPHLARSSLSHARQHADAVAYSGVRVESHAGTPSNDRGRDVAA